MSLKEENVYEGPPPRVAGVLRGVLAPHLNFDQTYFLFDFFN